MTRASWLAGLGSVLALLVLGPDGTRAAGEPPDGILCSFDQASRTLTVTVGMGVDEGGRVQRAGDEIAVLFESIEFRKTRKGRLRSHLVVTRQSCTGATATVHNTDTIRVLMEAQEQTNFDISLEGGPLAPGATPEPDGTSEIETSIEDLTSFHSIGFIGGPGSDRFRFGTTQATAGVNLNAQEEATSPDVDATLSPSSDPASDPSLPAATAVMGAGDDVVTDSGGPEFTGSFPVLAVNGGAGNDTVITTNPVFDFIKGAGGNDLIQGGNGRNVVFGGGGSDRIVTGDHGDDVDPGKGSDVAILGGGFDIVASHDRTRDRIQCGANRDFVSKDRKDRTPGCERRSLLPLHLKPFAD